MAKKRIGSKQLLARAVTYDIIGQRHKDHLHRLLKSEYGGEWLRPDVGESSCMPRTPVGLVNHPATNSNG
ncbi:MAG: hypothetical protein ACYSUC_01450, partial [Planctomycetota bacterium]